MSSFRYIPLFFGANGFLSPSLPWSSSLRTIFHQILPKISSYSFQSDLFPDESSSTLYSSLFSLYLHRFTWSYFPFLLSSLALLFYCSSSWRFSSTFNAPYASSTLSSALRSPRSGLLNGHRCSPWRCSPHQIPFSPLGSPSRSPQLMPPSVSVELSVALHVLLFSRSELHLIF